MSPMVATQEKMWSELYRKCTTAITTLEICHITYFELTLI